MSVVESPPTDDKSVGVIEELPERNIVKIAKPVGVIGALSPSTNPEATPVIKAISAIKGRNSIIIAPHPRAQKTNALIINLMRDAIVKMGAPADLVIGVDNPSVEKTVELMRQSDRILATGGTAMVKAAYSSGASLFYVLNFSMDSLTFVSTSDLHIDFNRKTCSWSRSRQRGKIQNLVCTIFYFSVIEK